MSDYTTPTTGDFETPTVTDLSGLAAPVTDDSNGYQGLQQVNPRSAEPGKSILDAE